VFGEDAYPDIYSKAAALFESIAKNHAFENANKQHEVNNMKIYEYLGSDVNF
jgi:death on curing protein